MAYAACLSQKTGQRYQLPSEAQWEYAARAGTRTARPWGEDDGYDQACAHANVADVSHARKFNGGEMLVQSHSCNDGYATTSPVARFTPNAIGLYDMVGNAWQWTADCANDNYQGAPADGSAWASGDCNRGVMRGGSWESGFHQARSASRLRTVAAAPQDLDDAGFRLVRLSAP